jgi:hypothetical protein
MLSRTVFFLGLTLSLAAPAAGQQPGSPRGARGEGPRPRAVPVEAALRHRQQLKLTEQQVADLTALREAGVKARQQHLAQVMELTSRFRAGEVSREEFRQQMHARRDEAAPVGRQQGERLNAILDDTQRTTLRNMVQADMRAMRRQADRPNRMGRMEGMERMRRPRP